MPDSSPNIRLAQTANGHKEISRQVEDLVDEIVHHGEAACANRLFALIEILTDSRTDQNDREGLSFEALQRTFQYTDAGRRAIEQEICRINPKLKMPSYIVKAS